MSTASEAPKTFAEGLLQKLREPFKLADDQVFISASIGIAIATGLDADADDLLRKADIALYEAKTNGRGRYQVFAGDMDDLLLRKRQVESELRQRPRMAERDQAGAISRSFGATAARSSAPRR